MGVYDIIGKKAEPQSSVEVQLSRIADALEKIAKSVDRIDDNVETLQKRGF